MVVWVSSRRAEVKMQQRSRAGVNSAGGSKVAALPTTFTPDAAWDKRDTFPNLTQGALIRYQSRVWRVGMVNDCRARLDPVSGVLTVSPTSGRSFQSYGTSVNIAPNAAVEYVDESVLNEAEKFHLLTLIERQLEAEIMAANASAMPVAGTAPETTGSKNKKANEERKAKLNEIKAQKAEKRQATAKAPKEPKPCKCGCGGQTGGFFIPGHDARFKGWLLQIERGQKKPEELLTEAVRKSYTWKKTADGKGLIPTTNYKGEPHTGYDQ